MRTSLAIGASLVLLAVLVSTTARADDKPNTDFFADWGTGLAMVRNAKPAVTDATIVNNVVRVNSQARYEASLLVAKHFYPFRNDRCGTQMAARDCVGAMVGAGLGSSSDTGRLINMIGVGLTLGGQLVAADGKSASSAWNFGIGVGRKFGVQTLGDGFTENAPPPQGETQVRYKTRDASAEFIYFTAHW